MARAGDNRHGHDHGHGHEHGHGVGSHGHGTAGGGPLVGALAANSVLAVAQIVGGLAAGSLALLADSAHQLMDVVGLVIALVAGRLAVRGPSARNTFGWGRADVVGAQASSVLLIASSVWIVADAVGRLRDPSAIDIGPVMVLAVVGLAINAISAVVVARGESTLSSRAAVLHLAGDALGSLGVLVAAALTAWTGWERVDPLAAMAISAWVAWSGVSLVRGATHVLLEATPSGIDVAELSAALGAVDGVRSVHHVHVWSIAHAEPALSAHLLLDGAWSLHDAQDLTARARELLHTQFGIGHATIEVECHPCEEPAHEMAPRQRSHQH